MRRIPEKGIDKKKLMAEMQAMREGDANWQDARTWSMVYYAGAAHHDFIKKAHNLFFAENGLNPIAFKSLKRMEAEVVRMTASMLHGDEDAVGTMTSGGTESILLAVKAARDRARRTRPWIRSPEMVLPRTIHVAFDKAAHYFGVKPRYVDTGEDYRADVGAMAKAIGRNTVLVAASAPQYPHGLVDPIEELGAVCEQKGVPLHVDACFGGFALPWIEKLGRPLPVWDFRVDGVTSISADVHKYGYAAKGASVIVYRDMSYLKHQFFVSTNWPGGIYASPSMPGTRPGGSIAAAWAAMQSLGEAGYLRLMEGTLEAVDKLKAGIEAIEGVAVVGEPHATVVAYQSDDDAVDIYAVADRLEAKGWAVDRQQWPNCIHLTVNAHNLPVVDTYLADVREAVAWCRAHPEAAASGNAAMYGMMAKIPFRGMVKMSVQRIMEAMYSGDGEMPDLANLGAGDDDGLLFKAINKYGDQAMALLDKLQAGQRSLAARLGRLR
jgi:sphinganine-1-phosphate aldolase